MLNPFTWLMMLLSLLLPVTTSRTMLWADKLLRSDPVPLSRISLTLRCHMNIIRESNFRFGSQGNNPQRNKLVQNILGIIHSSQIIFSGYRDHAPRFCRLATEKFRTLLFCCRTSLLLFGLFPWEMYSMEGFANY